MSKSCRICYGTEEDEEELGRLISPCKCSGTAKYVHILCLQEWRKRSTAAGSSKSFFECDLCKYQYSFRQTRYAAILMSWKSKTVATLVLLWSWAFALGFMAHPLLETHVTDEDIELILQFPNIFLQMIGVDIKTRLVPQNGWIEHQFLGTACIGLLGLIKFSFVTFYSSTFRHKRTLSLLLVVVGFVYSIAELYKFVGKLSGYGLRVMAGWLAYDVPEDLAEKRISRCRT
jgi:hypothetical protein